MIATFFLTVFIAGLGLAVYSMLHGVERAKPRPDWKPSAIFNAPVAAACAIALGAVGYLLLTKTALGIPLIFAAAIISTLAAALISSVLLARWALPYSRTTSDAEAAQGLLALVTQAISSSSRGEISFQSDGVRRTLAAESVEGSAIPRDAEVVIDTIQNGVARVELWSIVEQRL